jgi:hypothetical protein
MHGIGGCCARVVERGQQQDRTPGGVHRWSRDQSGRCADDGQIAIRGSRERPGHVPVPPGLDGLETLGLREPQACSFGDGADPPDGTGTCGAHRVPERLTLDVPGIVVDGDIVDDPPLTEPATSLRAAPGTTPRPARAGRYEQDGVAGGVVSVRTTVGEHGWEGACGDQQVQAERPVVDVAQVHPERVLPGEVGAA